MLAPESAVGAMLLGVQLAKGKSYSETITKLFGAAAAIDNTRLFMQGLADSILSFHVTPGDLQRVLSRCKQTEFSGTAYMPLPTEADLVKIIKEVQMETRYRKEAQHSPEGDGEITEGPLAGMTVAELMQIALKRFDGR